MQYIYICNQFSQYSLKQNILQHIYERVAYEKRDANETADTAVVTLQMPV